MFRSQAAPNSAARALITLSKSDGVIMALFAGLATTPRHPVDRSAEPIRRPLFGKEQKTGWWRALATEKIRSR
jgi:hypothetical protein